MARRKLKLNAHNACGCALALGLLFASLAAAQQSAFPPSGGSGTATSVGLSMPATFCSVTNSPVTTSGTLTCTYATGQTASLIFGTDGSGNVGLMNLTAAQLPNPGASSLGGVRSIAAVSHNFLTSISTSGVPAQAQPAFSDLSGSATAAQLPNPSASTLGGVESLAATSHQWINTISTSGVPASTQPTLADVAAGAAPTGLFDFSGSTNVLLPASAGAAPTAGGDIRYDSTQLRTVAGGDGALTGSFPQLIYWAHPTSDILCAHGGDGASFTFSYGATVCNNAGGTDVTSYTAFTSQFTIPANFLVQDKMLRVHIEYGMWSSSAAPSVSNLLTVGAINSYSSSQSSPTSSMSNKGFAEDCTLTANAAVGAAATVTSDCFMPLPNYSFVNLANASLPAALATNASAVLKIRWLWGATGLFSGTYTSGISATGTIGQTCALSAFNNGNSGGTATVALTGTNTIAGGTALVITNTGQSSTSAATSATVGNGTATCTGPATVSTVLGGAQGNAIQLRSVTIEELN